MDTEQIQSRVAGGVLYMIELEDDEEDAMTQISEIAFVTSHNIPSDASVPTSACNELLPQTERSLVISLTRTRQILKDSRTSISSSHA